MYAQSHLNGGSKQGEVPDRTNFESQIQSILMQQCIKSQNQMLQYIPQD